MRRKSVVALAITIASPLSAHHSFAMFDRSKEVELKDAVVKGWEWTSPHSWLYVVVPNGTNSPDRFSIEGGGLNLMRRLGFSKGVMKPGDKVTVYLAPLKNGDQGGALLAVVLPNGKMLGARLSQQHSVY